MTPREARLASPTRRRENRLLAVAICLLITCVLQLASRTEGYTRDEGYYFDAAEQHVAYYEELFRGLGHGSLAGFKQPTIDRYFGYNHEHPPLMKTLYGISWRLFHKCDCPRQGGRHPLPYPHRHVTLGLLSEADAFRLPAHFFGGLLSALIFLLGARAFSRRAGLVAAVLSIAVPRYFFHAQLSCFDAPMATTWLLVVYAWYRALDTGRGAIFAGVCFGLALATKHNAFFLPFVLIAHYLWVERGTLRAGRLPRIPGALWAMATVGPLVYLALWPWMWFDTLHLRIAHGLRFAGRFEEYFSFHLHHVYYNFEYFGTNYNKPPFPRTVPFWMTVLTAPVTTLFLSLLGTLALVFGRRLAAAPLRKTVAPRSAGVSTPTQDGAPDQYTIGVVDHGPESDFSVEARPEVPGSDADTHSRLSPGLLVVINALFPPAIISITGAPIFGATKHWLPAIPFIALLAGIGADALYSAFARALGLYGARERRGFAAALVLVCLPALVETWRAQPYGLSYYNLLAGGPAGGADLGMNRQFWGYSTRGILPWLDAHTRPGAAIYWHDTNQAQLNMNVRERLQRPDLNNTGLEEPGVRASSTAMVIHEKHFNKYEYWIWDFYGTAHPSLVLADEGVPMVTVYQRPPEPVPLYPNAHVPSSKAQPTPELPKPTP